MSIIFGNFESEVADLLQKINFLSKSNITSIDQLHSGIIVSKLLAEYLKRDKLEGILQGKTKEIWQCN